MHRLNFKRAVVGIYAAVQRIRNLLNVLSNFKFKAVRRNLNINAYLLAKSNLRFNQN